MDDSSYMGMNTPTGQPVDETSPNEEVIAVEQTEKALIQAAYKTIHKILSEEKNNVSKISDLPKIGTPTRDILISQGFEIELRRRYVNLIDNLMTKFGIQEEKQ